MTSASSSQGKELAEWLEPSLQDTAGQDPLGLNTITLDRILPDLIPAILQLSERARYFSIYPWMLWLFAERRLPATPAALDEFIRRREFELCLAMKLCRHCEVASAIGSRSAGPRITAGEDPIERDVSIRTAMGGFGLYYRSPLEALGAIAPAGTALGPEEVPTPIEVLAQNDLARELAQSFHAAIEDTEYFRHYERTDDQIPRGVLEELAGRICLCRLPERTAERDAIRRLMFEPRSPATSGECDARRRAFALFLDRLDKNPEICFEDGEFWRGLVARFQATPDEDSVGGQTTAAWGALAMKECAQDALCSIWVDFCRSGFAQQGLDGMTGAQVEEMLAGLATSSGLRLGGTGMALAATEPAGQVQKRAVAAARELDWEDVRAWTVAEGSALSGLLALLVFAERLPDPNQVHPLWREVAARRSEHQDGLLGLLGGIRGLLDAELTLAELMTRIVRRFVIAPHEAIAYSKLPEATFRFHWDESCHLRFFSPGTGGLDPFKPSDDRRATMTSLAEDLWLWEWDKQTEAAKLTADGSAFVNEVLG